jgi:hypothetical protein
MWDKDAMSITRAKGLGMLWERDGLQTSALEKLEWDNRILSKMTWGLKKGMVPQFGPQTNKGERNAYF